MTNSSSAARRAAYLFLTLCCGALLAFAGFRIYDLYGPSKISVGGIPYGLPAGTTIVRGDTPDLTADMAKVPVQVQTELRRATELARSGSYQAAYDIFDGVVVLYPDLLPALLGQVTTLFEMDSLTESQQDRLSLLIGKLQARLPGSGIAAYLESRRIYQTGNTSAALELARVASERAPALYQTRLWYGQLLLETDRFLQAANEFKTVVSLSSGDVPAAYEMLAELYHRSGQLDSCAALVEYALSQYPVNVKLLLLQGYMDEYQGHFDSAEKIYQRILAFMPDYAPARSAAATLGEKSPPGPGNGVVLSPQDRAQTALNLNTKRLETTDFLADKLTVVTELMTGSHRKVRFPKAQSIDMQIEHRATRLDLDFNFHVSNRSYVTIAMLTMPDDVLSSKTLSSVTVHWLHETYLDDTLTCRMSHTDDGSYLHNLTNAEGVVVCELMSRWQPQPEIPEVSEVLNRDL